jgi:hypothetical protein
MRKLTVKNFSVIKEAELEFGKITVLIGPQSSGKSLLCKLAYFLSKEVLEIAVGRVLNEFDFPTFEEDVVKRFREWFPLSGWGQQDWSISYTSNHFEVFVSGHIDRPENPLEFRLAFGDVFRREYIKQLGNARPWAKGIIESAFRKLMGRAFWDNATYIPSERSYFVDAQKGYRLLANQSDPIGNRFAEFYPSSLGPDIPKKQLRAHLDGELVRGGDSWLFLFSDGRLLPLNFLSRGSKELLPLLCALEMYSYHRLEIVNSDEFNLPTEDLARFDEFFVEEPEAHIFPKKQYEIVQYFAEFANAIDIGSALTITTHSPYILSSFNNLLEAWQVAASKPEAKGEVAKLIDERYWVRPSDFKAYCIHDGELDSIMDEETGLINGKYLDGVSSEIGSQFDELLRIGYVEA